MQQIMTTMPINEKNVVAGHMLSSRYAKIGYSRYFLPLNKATNRLGSPIRLNSYAAVTPLSNSDDGLYISLYADYDTSVHYNWDLYGYFQWTGGCCNYTPDHIALAWGGGLQLVSSYAYGYYNHNILLGTPRIPTTLDDVTPGSGVDYRFPESRRFCIPAYPRGCPILQANWGYSLATIHESRYHHTASNVVMKYVHTYSDTSVSVSFGLPASASISLSTADGNWQIADYVPVTF
jgi:hypothetical protein